MPAKQSHAVARSLEATIQAIPSLPRETLISRWGELYGRPPPGKMPRVLLELGIAYRLQERVYGGLEAESRRLLREAADPAKAAAQAPELRPGTSLVRTWNAVSHTVAVVDKGFVYRGKLYRSLTQIAKVITGTHQSGPNFFGLRSKRTARQS